MLAKANQDTRIKHSCYICRKRWKTWLWPVRDDLCGLKRLNFSLKLL